MALEYGVSEFDFWDMTLAELYRLLKAKRKMEARQLKQRAVMDHKLADLIGRSVARVYSDSIEIPNIEDFYEFLFDEEDLKQVQEKEQERQAELSAIRFKQFANSFNKRFTTPSKEVAND